MGFRFREGPVYKDARAFRMEIKKRILPKINKMELFNLGDQLLRALSSIILNIAEGAYRKSDKDFARFLNQAITSLYEVVACLDLLLDDVAITEQEHDEFVVQAESIAKQLNKFGGALKGSKNNGSNDRVNSS